MAVQAQCSSNTLLFNRNVPEQKPQIGNKYPLPPHHGGDGGVATAAAVLGHQSVNGVNHTLFNSYSGKRRREDDMNRFVSSFHQQAQCNQFMEVSQIQSRNVDVSTGLRLAFNDHQHHQQHHQQQQQQQQRRSFDLQSSGFVYLSSENLSNLINQQGDEIESYLQAQAEEMRRKLAEKRQRHYHALIGTAKETASRMLREKEAAAEKAARRNAELEARASQLTAEAEVWEARARAQEAVAAALQAQLQQAMVTGGCGSEVALATATATAAGEAGDAESSYIDPERVVVLSGPGCKACGKRVASVVLLPCRHLCVCSECDDVVQACPLCLSFRSSSIEVYMS